GRVKRLELRVQRFELWVVGIWLFELWSFRFWDEDPSHIRKRRLNRIALWMTPYGRRARPSVSSHGSPMGTADGAAHWPCLAATPDRRSSGCHRNGDRAHSPLACDAADRRCRRCRRRITRWADTDLRRPHYGGVQPGHGATA